MKSPFIKNIEILGKKEKIRLNRRVATFISCVFISVLFWLLMTLSKEYTIVVSYPVEYINAPIDKVIANNLPEKIDIEIRSQGLFLLRYKFKEPPIVNLDLKDSKPLAKNYYFLITNSQINKITDQFASRIKVQRITPDTVFLNFNKRVSKKVPVKSNLTLKMDNQFQQSDSIKIIPAMVEISGAADAIAKINYVETVPTTVDNINQSQALTLSILDSKLGDIRLSTSKVKVLISVKKYTEASIELPIEAINLPAGFTIKSFPDKVIVKYIVAFDNYEKINPSQFRAIIDYKKVEENSNKLKIVLEKFPNDVRSIKLNPEKVEYIIKK